MSTPRRRILLIAAVPVVAAAVLATAEFTSAFAAEDLRAAPRTTAQALTAPAAGKPTPTTTPAGAAGAPVATGTPSAAGSAPSATAKAPTVTPTSGQATSGKVPAPLTVRELPNQAKAGWKPIGSPKRRTVTPTSSLNECAAIQGATGWQQQGWASTAKTPAIQDTFTFATPADADHVRQSLGAQLDGCQAALRDAQTKQGAHTPDATSARTATHPAAAAWQYQWTAVPGMSAPGSQTHHVYLAQDGAVLTVLQYSDMASAGQGNSASPAADADLLTTLAGSLALTR
ncbi:hypothetical protein [Streptomyces sp. G-G2]|uniref:hypothetical protein n=1 Tax=Streptomyces sp. G-G2 TaxID=3046201 RepID=UPI0024BB8638|nr:hypothetical protein [Streptomyces sp. G-G2]MDJ0380421.1 hypothetical protein [Streptomyces sp. G-G2]